MNDNNVNNSNNNQNMNGNMEVKKSKFNLLTVILIILVLGLGGYLIYDKLIDNKFNNDSNNTTNNDTNNDTNNNDTSGDNNSNVTYKYEMLNEKFFASTDNKKTINDVVLGDKTISITLEKRNNGDENVLLIGNKEVLSVKSIEDVFVFDDILMVTCNYSLDYTGESIFGYDHNGNQVFNAFDATASVIRNQAIYSVKLGRTGNNVGLSYKNYYVENNKLFVYMTYIINGSVAIPNTEGIIDYCSIEKSKVDSELAKNNMTRNTKVEFVYELDYQGNYKFSAPKEIDSLTLNSFLSDCK